MPNNELTFQNLLPTVSNTEIVQDKLKNSTFIGIDFGTSTTVVSYTVFGDDLTPIKTDIIPVRQLNLDGSYTENHLIPSCIAWYQNKLFIGQTAKILKSKLTYGRNLWYSFKMKLGLDSGPEYFSTELPKGHKIATIENALDATKLFFKYLKGEIDDFISENNLPTASYFSISIPASFEANQRKDLKEALSYAGISFQDSLFIDEPNAAFLSYLIQANSNNLKNYNIPLDSPLHILVFDFGAGTCDITILEIGRKADRLYSKNIAISKFEQLGGDDIDKQIVKNVLFKQLLKQNNLTEQEIRTPEYNKIILPKLQPVAEYLKIQACKSVLRNMVGYSLPELAKSPESLKVEQTFNLLLPQHNLTYKNPSLSFNEFSRIMDEFISEDSSYDIQNDTESLKSIYTVVNSALSKANIEKDLINLVLLIGGSSYNPYIQNSLRNGFNQSEIEIPRDLQAHVATGTAFNSFLHNGMGVDMIKPIVSEPIIIILENESIRTLIREGTEIPCPKVIIDDLHPQKDNQLQIEIPICVSNKNKILTIAKIKSEKGFNKSDKIRLECEITSDKLIHLSAFIRDIEINVEPLNPFANSSLSTQEIVEKRLIKAININASQNNGLPSVEQLKSLADFYVKTENHLKAAETFETIQRLSPNKHLETSICYHYDQAGRKKLSDEWAEKAYENNPNATNAYNLALVKEQQGKMNDYESLMETAVSQGSNAARLVYGEYLLTRDEEKAKKLIEEAFNYWYGQFKTNRLSKNDHSRLIRSARQIGRLEVAEQVENAKSQFNNSNEIKWYSSENLASDNKNYLPEITE